MFYFGFFANFHFQILCKIRKVFYDQSASSLQNLQNFSWVIRVFFSNFFIFYSKCIHYFEYYFSLWNRFLLSPDKIAWKHTFFSLSLFGQKKNPHSFTSHEWIGVKIKISNSIVLNLHSINDKYFCLHCCLFVLHLFSLKKKTDNLHWLFSMWQFFFIYIESNYVLIIEEYIFKQEQWKNRIITKGTFEFF